MKAAEQIDRCERSRRAGNYRQWVKLRTNRARRRLGRFDPENAPVKKLTRGWTW